MLSDFLNEKLVWMPSVCCSDFCNESNGILVLGWFFLQTNFDFLTSHVLTNFSNSFERFCCAKF